LTRAAGGRNDPRCGGPGRSDEPARPARRATRGFVMLSILDGGRRPCVGWTRRGLLQVGTLSLFRLGLPHLLRAQGAAAGRGARRPPGFGRARSVILLYLQGAPSHIDLWDPKPDAPSGIRGEFRPIATSAPGVFLSETLPRLALLADKFALVRTL